ncbi:permease [Paracoccus tegillarcae]|nr:permease [Paracoccus tegillarcae]
MNDMEWVGDNTPEGPFAAIESMSDTDREAVAAAIERAIKPNELDEVGLASRLLWSYVADLERDWRAIEAGQEIAIDAAALKKAITSARDVREACGHLRQERDKVDKLRKDIAGGVGGGSLDLDGARDEIGRRLACLRRAGGG